MLKIGQGLITELKKRMMDTNKYYTPSIEEFHVGFEFEEWENPTFANEEWIAKKIDYFTDLEYVCFPKVDKHLENYILGTSLFRVKYIDSEDIKSFGFEESPDEPEEWFWNYKGDFDIQLYFNDKIENLDRGIGISIYNGSLVFSGYIKNKSELQQILKMIGVIG